MPTSAKAKHAFADTPQGQIHYLTAGELGDPVLMLHQTPRSSDEFLDVIPIFARHFRVFAMDTIGYGDSYRPEKPPSVGDYGSAAITFLDTLGIDRAHLVGHHTGSVIAIEIASSHPERVKKLVLSAAPYVNEDRRREIMTRPPVDKVDLREDGSHLARLWQLRMGFYPKSRPDLLTRFVIDALKAGESVEVGHRAVASYPMPERLPLIRAPTLVMCGTEDPFCFPDLQKVAGAIKGSKVIQVEGGRVPLVDQMPEVFSKHVIDFLLS
ncbi:MAG TPA: alpha/beta hydrolase [Nitrososphaerales archaeon]|nr:alpha/beta hydrolase [Nitrososphaerales archaeon]